MENISFLVISDIHFATGNRTDRHTVAAIKRRLNSFKKVLRSHTGDNMPHAIVLTGDIIDDGMSETAEAGLAAIYKITEASGIPSIFLPGNREADSRKFFNAVNDSPGMHLIKDFIFYTFADTFRPDRVWTRTKEQLSRLAIDAEKHPQKRLIVFQHAPVYPEIKTAYPYNPTNSAEIHDSYKKARVLLSVSGHCHTHIPLHVKDNVNYITAPAFCVEPFRYLHIKISEYEVSEKMLTAPS